MHEAQMHTENCFITLTYDDEHLPADYSVSVRVWQLFMKRFREFADRRFRFFGCAEYGDQEGRPHYHALIFGYRFNDLRLHSRKNTNPLYTSEKLSKLWPYGFSTIGEVNYQTAAYCARYSMKKIGGPQAADHYTRVHPVTGVQVRVKPEFATQSRNPGIGDSWLRTFKSDIYPSDFVVVDGKKHPVPKFYTRKLKEEEQRKLKVRRAVANATKGDKPDTVRRRENNTTARLLVREEVLTARASKLKRDVK